MLQRFLSFKAQKLEEASYRESSLFADGWGTPSRPAGIRDAQEPDARQWVAWDEVQAFLQMAEQALKVRTATNEALSKELASARSEKSEVEKTSSAAQEESSFLAEHMQALMDERAALKEALAKAQRERDYLATENELLRQEVLEGAERGEEGSAALQLLARQGEELRRAEQRSAALENDNVQLQARVSALERAHTAQATAMLSCLEESERVRLQQLTVTVPESPVGPLAAHHGGRHSEFTDDSCAAGPAGAPPGFPDALAALGSDCGSFVSCITPLTTGSSSGAPGSIFHSPEPSPDPAHQQQQQGKRPPVPGGSTAVGIGKA